MACSKATPDRGYGGSAAGGGSMNPKWKQVEECMWCVTREDLKQLRRQVEKEKHLIENEKGKYYNKFFDDPSIGPSVHQVAKHLKVPKGSSWALEQHPTGLLCDVFATHCWDEGIYEFIDAALNAFPFKAKHMYVCFLSNPQDKEAKDEFMNVDPSDSPFSKALEEAKYFIIIPNRKTSIYKRLWCVYEMFLAHQLCDEGLKIRLPWISSLGQLLWPIARSILLLPLPGFLLGYFFLGRKVGSILGPAMWLLVPYMSGTLVRLIIRTISRACGESLLQGSRRAWSLLKRFMYPEIAIAGFSIGISLDILSHSRHDSKLAVSKQVFEDKAFLSLRWAYGEGHACMNMFVAIFFSYVYDLLIDLADDVMMDASNKLAKATYTFNGKMDVVCGDDGIVQEVIADKQAHQKGIKPGHKIVNVDSNPFSQQRLRSAEDSKSDYDVTVKDGGESVTYAKASRPLDELRIWKDILSNSDSSVAVIDAAIQQYENVDENQWKKEWQEKWKRNENVEWDDEHAHAIDVAIEELRVCGKYDKFVKFNLERGLHPALVRHGVNPFAIYCGACAWTFWISTDLAGHGYYVACHAVPLLLSFVALSIVYGPNIRTEGVLTADDRYIFAVLSFVYGGLIFLMISNHHKFFNEHSVTTRCMEKASRPLLVVLFIMMLCVDACFYSGLNRYLVDRRDRICAQTFSRNDEESSDESASHTSVSISAKGSQRSLSARMRKESASSWSASRSSYSTILHSRSKDSSESE